MATVRNTLGKPVTLSAMAPRKAGDVQALGSIEKVELGPGETAEDVADRFIETAGAVQMIARGDLEIDGNVVDEPEPTPTPTKVRRRRKAKTEDEGGD